MPVQVQHFQEEVIHPDIEDEVRIEEGEEADLSNVTIAMKKDT